MNTHAFTVDLEELFNDYQEIFKAHTGEEDSLASKLVFRTDDLVPQLLDILAETNTKATFFTLGYIARHRPHLIKKIADAGHEIGIHGYSHHTFLEADAKFVRMDLTRAINQIQDITGKEVLWHRAPYFSIQKKNLWVFDILYELGIRYDSSIFSTKKLGGGLSEFPNQPCLIRFNGGELWEFPVFPIDMGPVTLPLFGGGYFRLSPYSLVNLGLKGLEKEKKSCVFYIHPYDLDPEPNPVKLPMSFTYRVRTTIRRKTVAKRLKKMLKGYQWTTMGAIKENYALPNMKNGNGIILEEGYELFTIEKK